MYHLVISTLSQDNLICSFNTLIALHCFGPVPLNAEFQTFSCRLEHAVEQL